MLVLPPLLNLQILPGAGAHQPGARKVRRLALDLLAAAGHLHQPVPAPAAAAAERVLPGSPTRGGSSSSCGVSAQPSNNVIVPELPLAGGASR